MAIPETPQATVMLNNGMYAMLAYALFALVCNLIFTVSLGIRLSKKFHPVMAGYFVNCCLNIVLTGSRMLIVHVTQSVGVYVVFSICLFISIFMNQFMILELLKLFAPLSPRLKGNRVKNFQYCLIPIILVFWGAVPFIGSVYQVGSPHPLAIWLRYGSGAGAIYYAIFDIVFIGLMLYLILKTIDTSSLKEEKLRYYLNVKRTIIAFMIFEFVARFSHTMGVIFDGPPGSNGRLFYIMMTSMNICSNSHTAYLIPFCFNQMKELMLKSSSTLSSGKKSTTVHGARVSEHA